MGCGFFSLFVSGQGADYNKDCPSWVADADSYVYETSDWGEDAKESYANPDDKLMIIGQSNYTGAKTTACIWVAQCPENDDHCLKNCPIALGIAYEESKWHPKAQSYDGIGRGLYQWGGPESPSCARGFEGEACNVEYQEDGTLEYLPGGGLNASWKKNTGVESKNVCSAYNPVLNTKKTFGKTNYGSHWRPTGAAWWSCDSDGKIKDWAKSKSDALDACVHASGKDEDFFKKNEDGEENTIFTQGKCAEGNVTSGYAWKSKLCDQCGDKGSEWKTKYGCDE